MVGGRGEAAQEAVTDEAELGAERTNGQGTRRPAGAGVEQGHAAQAGRAAAQTQPRFGQR